MTKVWNEQGYLVFNIEGLNASQRDEVRNFVARLYSDNGASGQSYDNEYPALDNGGVLLTTNGSTATHVMIDREMTGAILDNSISLWQSLTSTQKQRIYYVGLKRDTNALQRKSPTPNAGLAWQALTIGQVYTRSQLRDAIDPTLQVLDL